MQKEDGFYLFSPGAECPAEATEWRQHSGGSSLSAGPGGPVYGPGGSVYGLDYTVYGLDDRVNGLGDTVYGPDQRLVSCCVFLIDFTAAG